MTIRPYDTVRDFEDVLLLYASVNWQAYTDDPERLRAALCNSSLVRVCLIDSNLVGLIRVVSDNHTICYIQDILVRPDYQRRGIGRALVEGVLAHYADVRQVVLMTDDEERQARFYESLGFREIKDDLRGFVRLLSR